MTENVSQIIGEVISIDESDGEKVSQIMGETHFKDGFPTVEISQLVGEIWWSYPPKRYGPKVQWF